MQPNIVVCRKSVSTDKCQCSLFPKKNPIIRICCLPGLFATPIIPDNWSSTALLKFILIRRFKTLRPILCVTSQLSRNSKWLLLNVLLKICTIGYSWPKWSWQVVYHIILWEFGICVREWQFVLIWIMSLFRTV